jgi:hypothetical protein
MKTIKYFVFLALILNCLGCATVKKEPITSQEQLVGTWIWDFKCNPPTSFMVIKPDGSLAFLQDEKGELGTWKLKRGKILVLKLRKRIRINIKKMTVNEYYGDKPSKFYKMKTVTHIPWQCSRKIDFTKKENKI